MMETTTHTDADQVFLGLYDGCEEAAEYVRAQIRLAQHCGCDREKALLKRLNAVLAQARGEACA